MKRLQRAIVAILCVVCLALGVFACDGDTPPADSDKATYTVTVTGGTPTLLTTVTVKLQDADGKDATEAKTLKNGKATFKLEKGTYTVVLGTVADVGFGKYVVQDGVKTLTAAKTSTTIELKMDEGDAPRKTEYKVKFMLNSTTPYANKGVQICVETSDGVKGTCHAAVTDDKGEATWNVVAGNYHVEVNDTIPDGYYFDDEAYHLTTGTTTLTAYFKAYVAHTVTVKSATYDSAWNTWEPTDPVKDVELKVSRFDDDTTGGSDTVYAKEIKTDAKGEATFSAPAVDLWVDVVGGIPAGYAQEKGVSMHLDGADKDAGLTIGLYPIGSTVNTSAELKLDTATEISVLSSGYKWYEFKPTQSGEYTLTSTGNVDASCTMPSAISQTGNLAETYDKDGDNFTLTFNVGASEIGGNRWVFKIAAAEGTFNVTLTRTGDYDEPITLPLETIAATQVIPSANHPAIPEETQFKFIIADLELAKDYTTGYYLAGAGGSIVYVSLGGKYAPAGIQGGFQGIIESPTGLKSISLSDGETYNCEYTDFVKEYLKNLNADGLHPLTAELKTFLERYHKSMAGGDETCHFACGTYENLYNAPIGGSMVRVGDYRFTVAAGETKELTYASINSRDENQVAVTVTSGAVKLLNSEDAVQTELVLSNQDAFKVKNEGSAAVTVILHVEYKTADKQITEAGEYLVIASEDGTEYKFTAPKDGTYSFALEEGCGIDINEDVTYGEAATAVMTKNQTITFKVQLPIGENEEKIVKLTIELDESGTNPSTYETISLGNTEISTDKVGKYYTFTAPEAGWYKITASPSENAFIEIDDYIRNLIELKEGETCTIYLSTMEGSATYTVTISKE